MTPLSRQEEYRQWGGKHRRDLCLKFLALLLLHFMLPAALSGFQTADQEDHSNLKLTLFVLKFLILAKIFLSWKWWNSYYTFALANLSNRRTTASTGDGSTSSSSHVGNYGGAG